MQTQNVQKPQANQQGVDPHLTRNGGLSYLEIPATDLARSASFYESVLGWQIDRGDKDHPKFMDQTGHLLGRWIKGRAAAREPGLLPYIYVDRVEAAVKRAIALGGEIVKSPYPEGNLTVATIRDPAGNVIGLWQM